MSTGPLYDQDFVQWTQQQSRELREAARAGANLPIDWENVAEEIEDLGKSVRLELRHRLSTIIEHLLKLRYSPATEPSFGLRSTIRRTRDHIDEVLGENPSLRPQLSRMIEEIGVKTARRVARDLAERGEIDRAVYKLIESTGFSEADVLDDWFPEPAATLQQQ